MLCQFIDKLGENLKLIKLGIKVTTRNRLHTVHDRESVWQATKEVAKDLDRVVEPFENIVGICSEQSMNSLESK